MAHRAADALGAEGRYRRTPSSPSTKPAQQQQQQQQQQHRLEFVSRRRSDVPDGLVGTGLPAEGTSTSKRQIRVKRNYYKKVSQKRSFINFKALSLMYVCTR